MRYARLIGSAFTLAAASPACAQLAGASDDGVSLWRVAGALLLCFALALAGALALRVRFGRGPFFATLGGGSKRLQLRESLRITPQIQISIVACDDREMLIATSATGTHLLTHLPVGMEQ